MKCTVVIDAFPESARRYGAGWAVVAIDVIRAATTAITAVARGRRCIPVASEEEALARACKLRDPLLGGERKGHSDRFALASGAVKPARSSPPLISQFDVPNSPTEVQRRSDVHRPLVLLSSSGTRLICEAAASDAVYLACFRNAAAVARHLTQAGHARIAVLGAGTRDEFREEDQMCCAWIARDLVKAGCEPQNRQTIDLIRQWERARPLDCLSSRSVAFLRRTGQLADLHFILSRHNDLDAIFVMEQGEVVMRAPAGFSQPATENGTLTSPATPALGSNPERPPRPLLINQDAVI